MSSKNYLLKWRNHPNSFMEVLDYLHAEELFIDVTLACDGDRFGAHKVVLCACSPYFQRLLSENPCKHPIILLKGVKSEEMKALVEFMYKGELCVGQRDLHSLLKTAESLQIRGLSEYSFSGAEQPQDADSVPEESMGGVAFNDDLSVAGYEATGTGSSTIRQVPLRRTLRKPMSENLSSSSACSGQASSKRFNSGSSSPVNQATTPVLQSSFPTTFPVPATGMSNGFPPIKLEMPTPTATAVATPTSSTSLGVSGTNLQHPSCSSSTTTGEQSCGNFGAPSSPTAHSTDSGDAPMPDSISCGKDPHHAKPPPHGLDRTRQRFTESSVDEPMEFVQQDKPQNLSIERDRDKEKERDRDRVAKDRDWDRDRDTDNESHRSPSPAQSSAETTSPTYPPGVTESPSSQVRSTVAFFVSALLFEFIFFLSCHDSTHCHCFFFFFIPRDCFLQLMGVPPVVPSTSSPPFMITPQDAVWSHDLPSGVPSFPHTNSMYAEQLRQHFAQNVSVSMQLIPCFFPWPFYFSKYTNTLCNCLQFHSLMCQMRCKKPLYY